MENIKPYLDTLLPIGIFAVALIVLLVVKRTVFSRLQKWSLGTDNKLDDIFFSAANAPFNFLILVVSLWVTQNFLTIPAAYEAMVASSVKLFIILAALFFADRFLTQLIDQYARKNVTLSSSKKLITTLIHVIFYGFVALFILSAIGISITPFIASLGIGSMAIALALQDTLGQTFSGIYLLVDRPISKGDYISLGDGREGFVQAVGWRSTKLKLFSDDIVIIPNSKVASSIITNYEMPQAASSAKVTCGVHYDSDLTHVEQVVKEEAVKVMKEHPAGLDDYQPRFGYYEFGDSSINFYCRIGAKRFVDHYGMKSLFIKNLHKRFAKEGIIIPYPIRTVYMEKNS